MINTNQFESIVLTMVLEQIDSRVVRQAESV